MAERTPVERARACELGIILGTISPGPVNAITDVAGVRVGHTTIVRGSGPLVRGVGPVRTGVTAILPHGENIFTAKVPAAAAVFNGYDGTMISDKIFRWLKVERGERCRLSESHTLSNSKPKW